MPDHRAHATDRKRSSFPVLGLPLLAALLIGCRTPAPEPLEVPAAWPVRSGQAAWTPRRGAHEIAGDLTVAQGPRGEYLLEFSKPAMPLIRVLRRGDHWQIHAANGRSHRGRGTPPERSWFLLAPLLSGSQPPPPWQSETHSDDAQTLWRLDNPKTGEHLEGFLGP